MEKKMMSFGAFLGMIAIVLGAFGAHALKKVLTFEQLNTFEIGVKYQMYHALFLLLVGNIQMINEKAKKIIFYLISIGVFCFSGSIYFLATKTLTFIDFNAFGVVTPIGGLFLISGWLYLIWSFFNHPK